MPHSYHTLTFHTIITRPHIAQYHTVLQRTCSYHSPDITQLLYRGKPHSHHTLAYHTVTKHRHFTYLPHIDVPHSYHTQAYHTVAKHWQITQLPYTVTTHRYHTPALHTVPHRHITQLPDTGIPRSNKTPEYHTMTTHTGILKGTLYTSVSHSYQTLAYHIVVTYRHTIQLPDTGLPHSGHIPAYHTVTRHWLTS